MMEKNILIVSSSFYPINSPRSFRTTELVKEFARQGHNVTLLTPKDDSHHIPFEKEFGVTIKDLGQPLLPKIESQSWLFRVLRRGLLQVFEYPNIELMFKVKRALKEMSGFDLLISIAVPHPVHWGVAKAWKHDQTIAKKWVADCGDPYMGQTLDSFQKMFYFKYFEKSFCRKSDYITVPVEEAKEGYYPEFREKIKVIPQGFSFDSVEVDHSAYVKHSIPTFAYAGGLIPGGRDPSAFLEYLVGLEQEFKFILYTKNTALVEPWLSKGRGRIELREYIPRPELLKVLGTMDFLVNFENRSPLMMPSKLIDYYLAGRPVLNIPSDALKPDEIHRFLNGDYENSFEYNGVDKYRIENVCNSFLALCSNGRS